MWRSKRAMESNYPLHFLFYFIAILFQRTCYETLHYAKIRFSFKIIRSKYTFKMSVTISRVACPK